ncbi:MAG: VWA domain-containing protein [Acidobacteriota bacterium]
MLLRSLSTPTRPSRRALPWWMLPMLLVLALAPPLAAQADDDADANEGLEGLFIDVVDVNVVNVDVYVTDKKGNPITGLTKDDFVLHQDGRPVAISNFYAVESGRASRANTEQPALVEVPEAPVDPRLKQDERPEEQRLHLVIYIDNFNIHPFSRNRVFGFIRSFLRQNIQEGDRVMLYSYDRSLKMRHPFTGDPELIASSLYELEEVSGWAVHRDSDRKDILDAVYEAEDQYEVQGRARTYAENLYNDLSFSITALKDMVDQLAGLPGRKAVLYVSDGLAMRAGEDIYQAMQDRFRSTSLTMEAYRYDLTRDYQQLTQRANAHRVTFYTVDAQGLRTYSYVDVSNQTPGGGAFIDQVHFQNLQGPLQLIAEETGGMAIINTNNFNPMFERIARDFDTYYSLGYTPASEGSGRYRRLEVKLAEKQRGIRIRHREGYRDKPVETRMAESTMAALHHGYQRNDAGVMIEFGSEQPGTNGHFEVPMRVRVPIRWIQFLPREASHLARLRLFIAARDTEGRLSPVQDVRLPIDIPSNAIGEIQDRYYDYQITLQMRRGSQSVAVGVRDEIGAETAFVTRGVTIGPAGSGRRARAGR